jgi:uncharacterized membrane protein
MKLSVVLLAMLLLFAIVPSAMTVYAEDGEDRQSGLIRVKLYAQMSTTETSLSTEASSANARTADSISFTSVELDDNLVVRGIDTGVGQNKGLVARIGVSAPSFQTARVTVQVLDEDRVIANKTQDVPSLETRWDWRLPFTSAKDSHTFIKRHDITLRVNADRNVIVRTDSDSYLELFCEDHLHVNAETRDVDDRRASTFYPNDLLDQRHVMIEGDLENPFGPTDIGGVNISIKRPDGQFVVEDQSATVGDDLNYTYDWNYASGLPSGTYTINVTASDLQRHEFTTVITFLMGEYGVRLSAEGEEAGRITKSTTSGNPAKYTLTVLNIGGKSAQIIMDEGSPVSLWSTSFSKSNFNLAAGDDNDITFDVLPDDSLGGGNQSVYVVTATVANDPGMPSAKDILEVETFVRDVAAFTIFPAEPDPTTVGVGGSVDHTFTLRNSGEFTTTVDLSTTGVPNGWEAEFRGSRVSSSAVEDLRTNEVVDIVLRVTAPDTSNTKKANLKIRCQSREYTEVFEEFTLEIRLVIGLRLTPTSPLSTTQDPGGSFSIFFEAYNNDPSTAHDVSFSVKQGTNTWPSSSFRFTPSTLVRINPESRVEPGMGLQVNVPSSATAGAHRFTIEGVVDDNDAVSTSFDFNVTINLRHQLAVVLDPANPKVTIGTKDESIVFLTIRNDGNVVETVNVTIDVGTPDVEVRINDALTAIILGMNVDPGESRELKIGFKAKDDATHNDEFTVHISVTTEDDPTPLTPNDFKLKVEKSTAEFWADMFKKFAIMIFLVGAMFVLMVYRPKNQRPDAAEDDEKSPEAHHGTMVKH